MREQAKGKDIFIHEKDRGREREKESSVVWGKGPKGPGQSQGQRVGRVRYLHGAGEGTGWRGRGLPLSCFQSLMARRSAPPAPADGDLSVSLCIRDTVLPTYK